MPVSLLTEDGKLYLIAGEHEPLNKELAPARSQDGHVARQRR
jgi:hypothetical protein